MERVRDLTSVVFTVFISLNYAFIISGSLSNTLLRVETVLVSLFL